MHRCQTEANDFCIEDEVLDKFNNFKYTQKTDSSNRKSVINMSKLKKQIKEEDSQSCTSVEFKNGICY
jgi:hypothetical protein